MYQSIIHHVMPSDKGKDSVCRLTLPYLLNSVLRSVALVVEDSPLTHRFLLLPAAAPPPTATHRNK